MHHQSDDPSPLLPTTSPDPLSVCRSRPRRRSSHLPTVPPSCTLLYCSLLRSSSLQGEQVRAGVGGVHEHYTPPPMLCPLRAGTGLYCNLASRRQQRAQTVRLQNSNSEFDVWETGPVTCLPSEMAPSLVALSHYITSLTFCREWHHVCVHFSFFLQVSLKQPLHLREH